MTLRYDRDRLRRTGMPEAVLCLDKSDAQLLMILETLGAEPGTPVLFTRLAEARHDLISDAAPGDLDYDPVSQTAFLHGRFAPRGGSVAVVTAGTSDVRVSAEACRTLEFAGVSITAFVDVGVAGLWRLTECLEEITAHDVVVVVAGMDGALASVLGGLVAAPLIAVPTSTGYGAARGGETALHSMLTSCAQGVVVTNIDNGFGAACAAIRILGAVEGRVHGTMEVEA